MPPPSMRGTGSGSLPPSLPRARRRRGERGGHGPAISLSLAASLLLLAMAAFLAEIVYFVDPAWHAIANVLLLAVLALALGAAAVTALARPAARGAGAWETTAAAAVALLACLDLLARTFQHDGLATLAAVTLGVCMVTVASMLATVAMIARADCRTRGSSR